MITRSIEAGEQLPPPAEVPADVRSGRTGGWKSLIGWKTAMADSVPWGRA
jgi:hypothetical protein